MTVPQLSADATAMITRRFDALFEKSLRGKRGGVPRGQAADLQGRIFSRKLGIDYRYAATPAPRPYHIASIGKMFTAVLIGQLLEKASLGWDARIAEYFNTGELSGLFVHQGRDYAGDVTVRHLLSHTSGAADYFGGRIHSGVPFSRLILEQPDRHWTPQELLGFSREQQHAVAPPGTRFHYSDTGYILLGLLIERVTGDTFEHNLHRSLLDPLGMRDTYMLYRSEPSSGTAEPLAPIWFSGSEISGFRSLSCDWAGGGLVSTTEDLLRFGRALREGKLLLASTLQMMDNAEHRFRPGLHYGQGIMEVRFEQFFFLLRGLPRLKGHIGVLATHLFWDPATDTHIVLNFGSEGAMVQSFKTLIPIVSELRKAARA